jgi:predicted aldo/keto reductase-like oxidoreductase
MKKFGFGLMRLPLTDSNNHGSINQELVDKI